MLQSAKRLGTYSIGAVDGDAGRVDEFYFDDASWKVRYLVVRAGGRFANRMVLVAPEFVKDADRAARTLHADLTKEQVENGPGTKTDRPVVDQEELAYREYHETHPPGTGWQAAGDHPAAPDERDEPGYRVEGDPHLRSTKEVAGYGIHAGEDEIGHVEDFIVDDEGWVIRYVAVDTRNWLPGKKVLVSPQWTSRISWSEKGIFVDLAGEEIKTAPEWGPNDPIDRAYEAELHAHYGRTPYWESR